MKTKIILAGGRGFLGSVLADYFGSKGMEVVIFTRKPNQRGDAVREVRWDGENLGEWTKELEGARALINLAGISVNCRYHARNRKLMLDSRLNSTRLLGEAVGRSGNPPSVWLNSSTATIYKHNFGPAWEETGEIGGCSEAKDIFSVHIATEWERVFNEASTPRTRKVALRSAMVLGRGENSVLPNLLRLAQLGLGGSLAGGRQFVSWIHEEDFCLALEWIIEHETLGGPVNLAAPNPVTNAEFMAAIRKACGMPFGLPAKSRPKGWWRCPPRTSPQDLRSRASGRCRRDRPAIQNNCDCCAGLLCLAIRHVFHSPDRSAVRLRSSLASPACSGQLRY